MKKNLLLAMACLACSNYVTAQNDPVLMRINDSDITKSEFEYIYNKHNSQNVLEKKDLSDYLQLFINFKLKVNDARQAGIDTSLAFRDELAGYRMQVAKSYLTDEAAEEAYVKDQYEEVKKSGKAHRIKFVQIFRHLPQNMTQRQIQSAENQMDSIYRVIQSQPNVKFENFVNQFSDDNRTLTISYLQTPESFENVVFALPVGEISKPFFSPYGIHIVKVLDQGDLLTINELKKELETRALRRDGYTIGTGLMIERLKKEYNYTPNFAALNELKHSGQTKQTIFTLDGHVYDGALFKQFASSHPMALQQQLNAFTAKSVLDYENSMLEKKYPDFRLLMQEYHDGMLLFEISNQKIWEQAQADEAGQSAYFYAHNSNYHWDLPRFNGVIIHCADKKTLKQVKKQLKKFDSSIDKKVVEKMFNTSDKPQVIASEGIYAVGENPYVDYYVFKVGPHIEMPSYTFTYTYGRKQKGPADYKEVKGQVIADYQNYLEDQWVKQLRAKSRVEINQEVLKTVNND